MTVSVHLLQYFCDLDVYNGVYILVTGAAEIGVCFYMAGFIGNFSPTAVIEAIEGNLVDSSAALGRSDEGVVFHGSDVTWVYTGLAGFSRVLRARFTEDAEDRVAQIHEYFKQWNAAVSWVVGPSSYPTLLGEYLSARGFGIHETWVGMAMDLPCPISSDKNAPAPATALTPALSRRERGAQLQIREVEDEMGLAAWAGLWADSVAADVDSAVNLFSSGNAAGDKRCRYYLGWINEKPVARAMTFQRNDVVGLYWISSIVTQNSDEIRMAMARRALYDAARAGAKAAVMVVPSDGQSFSEGLGFKPYCQFNTYCWPPAPSFAAVC